MILGPVPAKLPVTHEEELASYGNKGKPTSVMKKAIRMVANGNVSNLKTVLENDLFQCSGAVRSATDTEYSAKYYRCSLVWNCSNRRIVEHSCACVSKLVCLFHPLGVKVRLFGG